jgi:hypothetical protein
MNGSKSSPSLTTAAARPIGDAASEPRTRGRTHAHVAGRAVRSLTMGSLRRWLKDSGEGDDLALGTGIPSMVNDNHRKTRSVACLEMGNKDDLVRRAFPLAWCARRARLEHAGGAGDSGSHPEKVSPHCPCD